MPIISSSPESAYLSSNETSLNIEQIQEDMDRQRDPRPVLETKYIQPRTSIEKNLAEIWAELLHLDMVGINDDFFQLGGHSLLAVQILAKVKEIYSVDVTTLTFFEAESTTVAEFAQVLEKQIMQKSKNDDLNKALEEISKLSEDEVKKLLKEIGKS